MTTRRKPSTPPEGLRADAEKLPAQTPPDIARMTLEEAQKLVQELQVRLTELERQNDELRRTQRELEAARGCLRLPYDAAPMSDPAGQKPAAAMLQAQEEQYRKVVEACPDCIFILHKNRFVLINGAGLKLFGASRSEAMIGRDVFDFIHPDSRELIRGRIALATQSDQPLPLLEQKWLRPDGSVVEAEATSARIQFQGQPALLVEARDITARKQAEVDLQASEERFRLLAESITDVFWIASPDLHKVHYVSPGYERIWGRTAESLYANPHQWIEVAVPEDRERVAAVFDRLRGKEPTVSVEYRITQPGGAIRWVQDRGFQVRDAAGNLIRLTGVAQDITERKLMEETVEHSRRLLAESEKMGKVGSWELDIDSQQVTWTETVYAIHEQDPARPPNLEEAIGFYTPACQPIIKQALQGAIERGEPYDLELQIITAKGNRREVHTIGHADLAHHTVFGFFQDITAQKQAEEKLRDSEERHRLIFTMESDAIFLVDRETLQFIDVNPAAERMYGYSRAEFLRMQATEVSAEPEKTLGNLGSDFTKTPVLLHRRKDGTVFPVEVSDSLLEYQHRTIKIGTMRDITERKQADEKLRESEQKLSKMFQSSPVAISLSTVGEGRLLEVNEEYLRMMERTRDQVIGRTSHELGLWVDPAQRTVVVNLINQQSALRNIEMDLRAKSGRVNHVLWSGEVLDIHGEHCLLGSALDITERKHTEMELQRSQRALKTISVCNQTLVHAATEAELLQQICRVVVEVGGYRMAWVGFAENDEAKTVRVAAMAGHETNYLAEAKISWSEADERGRGPTGTAIRAGQIIVCQDTQTDPIFAPWKEAARQRGYESSICLPLRHAEKTFGIVMIYSAETSAFQYSEVTLLTTMSEDLAYGIYALRMRAQHQLAEAALRESEEVHRSILTHAPVGIFQSGQNRMLFVNPAMATMFGYANPADMLASDPDPASIFVHPEQRSQMIHAARSSGTYVNCEVKERRKDGSIITTSTHLRVILDDAGSLKFVEGFVEDITERKRMEESHARLATAIEQAAETVVITNTKGEILYVNPAFEKTSGYTRAEALGQTPRLLKSGKQQADHYRHLWDTLQRGEVWTGHFINKHKNGTLYEEEATISPIRDTEGAIINYVAVKRNVTREVQLESQLRQTQKMEAIGTLAGGIAHDFNNMLGSIFGYAHLLQQDTEGNPLARDSVEEILKAANRAKELVQQILTFSRQRESSRQIIRLEPTIKEAMKFLRASLPAQIKIEMQLAPETPAVLADATQIYQVTMNLATNALHAMEGRPGQLTVTLESFQPDEKFIETNPQLRPVQYARLTVADNGHGMDANTLERIFDPFFTTKPVGKGTGLGLSVVHGIIKSHEGVITVESQPGQGATFRLYFPAQTQAEPAAADAGPARHAPGHGERILLLDDETALTSVLQKMLRRLNYQVATSNHPGEAIRLVRENPAQFDLVITDLTMPEVTGLEVAGQLHAIRPDLRVILMSGYSATVNADRLLEAGICERLQKPVSVAALAEALKRVLKPS